MERSSYLDYLTGLHTVVKGLGPTRSSALRLQPLATVYAGAGNHQHVMHWDTLELPASAMITPGGLENAVRNTWGLIA
jgi:hypothetical protein